MTLYSELLPQIRAAHKRRRTKGRIKHRIVNRQPGHFSTTLSLKLARLYQTMTGLPFPGGTENAYIQRSHAGHWQRSQGAMSWFLEKLDDNKVTPGLSGVPISFGSQWPATVAIKDPGKYIVCGW